MKKLNGILGKNVIFYILCLGLLLRLFIIFLGQSSGDVNNHIVWSKVIFEQGSAGFYEKSFAEYLTINPNYPPLIIYAFLLFDWLYQQTINFVWFLNITIPIFPSGAVELMKDNHILPGFLKLPAVFADIGVAYLVFLFTKKVYPKAKKSLPIILASFVLFNPAFFYNSAYWGQVDIIPVFFVILSLYTFLYTNKQFLSPPLLLISLLFKQTVVVFLPVFLLLYLKKLHFKQILLTLVICILFMYIVFLPFYKSGNIFLYPFVTYWQEILTASASHFATYHAFNFWALITGLGHLDDLEHIFLGVPYLWWGYLITGIIIFTLLFSLVRQNFTPISILFALCLSSFASFLFLTRMHERHLLTTLPFLLLIAGANKKLQLCFIVLSILHLINLYHDTWWPEVIVAKEIISSPIIINGGILIMLGIFVYLYVMYLRSKKQKNLS